jgi:hypothetical protein
VEEITLKKQKIYLISLCILSILAAIYLWRVENQKTIYLPQKEPTIIFRNTGWEDQMIIKDKNKIYRASIPTETATIVERTDNFFTLKWDNWGTEVFVKQDDGTYLIQK